MHDHSFTGKRIAIVGAGPAGLCAAHKLESAGADVTVLESENRIGGRIYTNRSSAGQAEFGAMRLHPSHKLTLGLIETLGLRVRRFINNNPAAYYLIGGSKFHIGDQSMVAGVLGQEAQNARGAIHQALQKLSSQISDDDLRNLADGTLPDRLQSLDAVSLWDLLPNDMSLGAKMFGMLANSLLQYSGVSGLEMALLARFANGDVVYEIDGGMDQLTASLAAGLRRRVLVNHQVKTIRALDHGVATVSMTSSGIRFDTFDCVICTIPAPAVARIKFVPELPFVQRMSLNQVHYTTAVKSLVSVKKRVWELKDKIYGGISITDRLAQNVVYPSDNRAQNHPCPVAEASSTPLTLPSLPMDRELSMNPSMFCGLYARESAARQFMSLGTDEKDAEVIRILEALHPGIAAQIIDIKHLCWDLQTATGGGAFAHYLPGERQRVQQHLQHSWPHGDAKVWFAGEHLSVFHGWIEGALQSVEHVLDKLTIKYSAEPACHLMDV